MQDFGNVGLHTAAFSCSQNNDMKLHSLLPIAVSEDVG